MTSEVTLYVQQQKALDASLAKFGPALDELAAHVDGLVVTPDNFDACSTLFATIRKTAGVIESDRRAQTDRLNRQKREIDGQFRPLKERADALGKQVSDALAEYNRRAREAQRVAEEQAARERAAAEEQERNRQAEAMRAYDAGEPLEAVAEIATPEPVDLLSVQTAPVRQQPVLGAVKTSRTSGATVSMVRSWEFEVTDPNAVPREFLTVDSTAIAAAVKAGTREIAGVRIYEVERARARTR